MTHTILRLPTVQARTGLSRSTIYLRISEGNFPKQVQLGERAVGWLESELDEWISSKIISCRQAENHLPSDRVSEEKRDD